MKNKRSDIKRIYRFQTYNDWDALQGLLKKYNYLLEIYSKKPLKSNYYLRLESEEREELFSIAKEKFIHYVLEFDFSSGSSFKNYISKKLGWSMHHTARKNSEEKQEKIKKEINIENLEIQEKEQEESKEYETLHEIINSLTPRKKEVITMHFFENMRVVDIAKELGISIKSVSTHLTLAKEEIKKRYPM